MEEARPVHWVGFGHLEEGGIKRAMSRDGWFTEQFSELQPGSGASFIVTGGFLNAATSITGGFLVLISLYRAKKYSSCDTVPLIS